MGRAVWRIAAALLVVVACSSVANGLSGMWPAFNVDPPSSRPSYYTLPSNSKSATYKVYDLDNLIKKELDMNVPGMGVEYSRFIKDFQAGAPGWNFLLVGGYIRDLLRNVQSKDIDIGVWEESQMGPTARNFPRTLFEKVTRIFTISHPDWFRRGKDSPANIWMSGAITKVGQAEPGNAAYVTPMEFLPAEWTVGKSNYWRDFTVNAVYYDMDNEVVFDATGRGMEDLMTNTLRVACFDEDIKTWGQYWMEGLPDGYRKLQRYLHMRMKGFKPDETTKVFFRDMFNMLNRQTYTQSYEALSKLRIGLERQTFAPEFRGDKLKIKLRQLLNVAMEDGLISTVGDFQSVIMKWWIQFTPSTVDGRVTMSLMENGMTNVRVAIKDRDGYSIREYQDGAITSSRSPDQLYNAIEYVTSDEVMDAMQGFDKKRKPYVPNYDDLKFLVPSKESCEKVVNLALYNTAQYDGMTLNKITEMPGDLFPKKIVAVDLFRMYVEKVTNAIPKVAAYGPVKSVVKKVLVIWLKDIVGFPKSDPSFDPSLGMFPGYVGTSRSILLQVIRSGNIREMISFLRLLAGHQRSSLTQGRDQCAAFRNPPIPYYPLAPFWGFVTEQCKASRQCNRVFSDMVGDHAVEMEGMIPPLSELENDYSSLWKPLETKRWLISNSQPNPLGGYGYGDKGSQNGYLLQCEGNGFKAGAGVDRSITTMFAVAAEIIKLDALEMELFRLGVMGAYVPTKMGSLYDILMAAEPYMKTKLMDLTPEQYLTFGENLITESGLVDPHDDWVVESNSNKWEKGDSILEDVSVQTFRAYLDRIFAIDPYGDFRGAMGLPVQPFRRPRAGPLRPPMKEEPLLPPMNDDDQPNKVDVHKKVELPFPKVAKAQPYFKPDLGGDVQQRGGIYKLNFDNIIWRQGANKEELDRAEEKVKNDGIARMNAIIAKQEEAMKKLDALAAERQEALGGIGGGVKVFPKRAELDPDAGQPAMPVNPLAAPFGQRFGGGHPY